MRTRRNRYLTAMGLILGMACFAREPMLMPDGGGGSGGGEGGGGSGSGGGAGAGGAGAGEADTVSRTEFKNVVKQRDDFKARERATINLFASSLGIDPSEVKIVATGDAETPFKLEAPGLEEISTAVKETRTKKPVKREELEREFEAKFQKKLTEGLAAKDAREKALTEKLKKVGIKSPLRAAFVGKGAIDPDAAMKLSEARVRSEVEWDEETGMPNLKVEYLGDDDAPLLDKATGKPVTDEQFADAFLAKNTYLRHANYRGGSGASGNMNGKGGSLPGSNNGNLTPVERGLAAADALFGVKKTT